MKKFRMFILTIAIMLLLPISVGAKTKKMTVYNDVCRSGNYLFCSTSNGFYKVNIKTWKKTTILDTDEDCQVHAMKKNGSYIYFMLDNPTGDELYRVKISNNKVKRLYYASNGGAGPCIGSYVISGKKLYFNDKGGSKTKRYVAKLNGKSRKKTKIKTKNIYKRSNSKGYKIEEQEDDYEKKIYLIVPDGFDQLLYHKVYEDN